MSKAREEAKRLIERFEDIEWNDTYNTEGGKEDYQNFMNKQAAKECALICVDEIVMSLPLYDLNPKLFYYEEVKKEIENFKTD